MSSLCRIFCSFPSFFGENSKHTQLTHHGGERVGSIMTINPIFHVHVSLLLTFCVYLHANGDGGLTVAPKVITYSLDIQINHEEF